MWCDIDDGFVVVLSWELIDGNAMGEMGKRRWWWGDRETNIVLISFFMSRNGRWNGLFGLHWPNMDIAIAERDNLTRVVMFMRGRNDDCGGCQSRECESALDFILAHQKSIFGDAYCSNIWFITFTHSYQLDGGDRENPAFEKTIVSWCVENKSCHQPAARYWQHLFYECSRPGNGGGLVIDIMRIRRDRWGYSCDTKAMFWTELVTNLVGAFSLERNTFQVTFGLFSWIKFEMLMGV